MTALRLVDAAKLEKLLLHLGFVRMRQKGSHIFFSHCDGRFTTIPHHRGNLSRPLIREILREIEVSVDEYNKLLDKL